MLLVWLYFTRGVSNTVVPELTGRQLEEVRTFVQDRDLRIRVHKKSSLESPEGEIIRQIPNAGALIKETRAIELYVSKGPEMLSVPNLVGESLLEARNFLRRNREMEGDENPSFYLGNISRVFSEHQPEDHIVAQQPRPDQRAVQGSEIDILLSKGSWPRRTTIPDLVGLNLDKARDVLRENHLNAGNIRYTYRSDSPATVVLEQFPPEGRIVQRRQSVTLTANLDEPDEPENRVVYSYVRINPPLDVLEGHLRVVMNDRRGSRVVFDDMVQPGETVQFLASVEGKAQLFLYWNGEFYQYRTLERS